MGSILSSNEPSDEPGPIHGPNQSAFEQMLKQMTGVPA